MSTEYEKVRRAGDFIRERMGNKPQREVATGAGVNLSDLSRILTGQVAKPSMDLLCRIGNYLEISPNELADWYGYRTLRPFEQESERVQKAIEALSRLPDEKREQILNTLEILIKAAQ